MVYNPSPRGLDVYSLINVTTPFKSSTIKGSRNRILLVVLSRFRFIFKKTATIFQCITCELCIKIGEIHPRVLLGWTIVRTLDLPKLWLFTIYRCAVKVGILCCFYSMIFGNHCQYKPYFTWQHRTSGSWRAGALAPVDFLWCMPSILFFFGISSIFLSFSIFWITRVD